MIDIIIPIYLFNDEIIELTRRTFVSIKKSSTLPFRVLWMDNGSEKNLVLKLIRELNRENVYNYKVIYLGENLGYTKAVNQGISLATAPYVVLGNNDIVANGNWAIYLTNILKENPSVGCVSPLSDTKSYQTSRDIYKEFGRTTRWLVLDRPISMFFTMFRKGVLDSVGFLNTRLESGFGTDDDYFYKMKRKNFLTAVCCSLVFHHSKKVTFHRVYKKEVLKALKGDAISYLKKKGRMYPEYEP